MPPSKPMPRSEPGRALVLGLLVSLGACTVQTPRGAVREPAQPMSHPVVDPGYDVAHYALDLELSPDRPVLEGSVTISMATTRPVDTIVLDAADMEILAVEPDVAWEHDGAELSLPLAGVLDAGEDLEWTIRYRAAPLGGMHFVLPEHSGLGHIPHLFTQGEDIRARFWFPCHDEPWDRASHEMRVTMPRSWSSVAAGRRLSRETTDSGEQVVEHWAMAAEMPTYLVTLAAGPFLVLEEEWRGIPLMFVGEPGDEALLRGSFAETAAVMDFLDEETGFPYPFAKYAQVAVRDFPFGGMENVSATTVTRNALRPAHLQEQHPSWGLVAHEAAHQWFGDIITCETWAHAWLNEGFATYYTLLYRREREGDESFRAAMGATIDRYMRACSGKNLRPLVKDSFRLPMDIFFDGTIYPGGASRLQLLRGILGDETYRAGITRYLEDHAYTSVDSDALRQSLEAASGKDLGPFFDIWVEAPGYPTLEVRFAPDAAGLRVLVSQVQDTSRGVPAEFLLPLDLRWSEDGVWKQQRFEVLRAEEEFVLPIGKFFDGFVVVDPDVLLPAELRVFDGGPERRARAMRSDRSRDRILALRALVADEPAAEDLRELLWTVAETDPVGQVREEALRGLQALGALVTDLERTHRRARIDEDDSLRLAWWRALCAVVAGDAARAEPRALAAWPWLDAVLEDTDRSLAERAAALPALARVQPLATRAAWLQRWLDPAQPKELQVAALAGMRRMIAAGEADYLELAPVVLPWSWGGHETATRVAAMKLLALGLDDIEASAPSAFEASVVDSLDQALMSWNALLRRQAVGLAVARPDLFAAAFAELDRREPDARVRQLLRDASR